MTRLSAIEHLNDRIVSYRDSGHRLAAPSISPRHYDIQEYQN